MRLAEVFDNSGNTPVAKPEHMITMNLSGVAGAAVSIVRIGRKLAWRRDVMPAIKLIAADIAGGKPVLWKNINVFEGPGDTLEDCEAQWQEWLARETPPFPMYEISEPGKYVKVGTP